MKNIQSLHSHTLLSDGKLSHLEMLKAAENYGISVLAFTDHDYVPNETILQQLQAYTGPVKWLIGIEISAGLPKELGGGVNGPHMVGLFVDPTNENLVYYCKKTQEERFIRMRKMVKNFQDLGFDITEEDCSEFTTGASIGQPHIVEALKSKEKNLVLMGEFVEKMRKAAENDPIVKHKYDLMMQRGERQYPYVLFLNSDAFVPGVKVPYQYWLDLDNAASLIRSAGGVAVIAHYSYGRAELPLEMIERLLKEGRLDGMETVYGIESIGTSNEQIFEQDKHTIRQWLKKYQRVASGGSDAHKELDLQRFAESQNYSKETEGMVEKIKEYKKLNTTWSNLG